MYKDVMFMVIRNLYVQTTLAFCQRLWKEEKEISTFGFNKSTKENIDTLMEFLRNGERNESTIAYIKFLVVTTIGLHGETKIIEIRSFLASIVANNTCSVHGFPLQCLFSFFGKAFM